MKVILKKSDGYTEKPGHWWRQANGHVFVTCQHDHASLAHIVGHPDPARDWQIDAAGNVTPSIWIKGDCNWHVFAQLEGWVP